MLRIFQNYKLLIIIVILFLILSTFSFVVSYPINFIKSVILEIKDGTSVKEVGRILKDKNIIQSSSFFNFLISARRGHVVAGYYYFEKPQNIFVIVKRISKGEYGIKMRSVLINEGLSVKEIAEKIKSVTPDFDDKKFIEIALPFEGYLFPDTYHISPYAKPEEVLKMMRDNFDQKIKSVNEIIKDSKYTLKDIIIMASLIEKEATHDSMQEISNILWRRIEIGMPLQVDATFVYEIGKGTFDLTKSDLENDTKYNTYTNNGLPPTPIGNPGIISIKAAANPQKTKNLYFLTGMDGIMHFASDFDQHKSNKLKYLR